MLARSSGLVCCLSVITFGCSVTVQEEGVEDSCVGYSIQEVQIDQPSYFDGTKFEGARDIYVTFSEPAENVRLEVVEQPSGEEIGDFFYQEELYVPDQVSFALTVSELKPLTGYTFTVSGDEIDGNCAASYAGTFKTIDF